MHVFEAWLVYLIVVAVVWLILQGATCFGVLGGGAKLFIALLAGAIVVLFMTGSIQNKCPDDSFWICLLLLFAYLAPIIVGLWLLFNGGWDCMRKYTTGDCDVKVDHTYVCEGNTCYPVMSRVRAKDGDTTFIHQ